MNAPATSPGRGGRPPAALPRTRPGRAGRFAWAALVHLVLALLLAAPALHPARAAVPGAEAGIRARDAVELAAARQRDGSGAELTRHLGRAPQPPRAGADASPFLAAAPLALALQLSTREPPHASAADPRSARRPAYYANAPPLPGRFSS